MTSYRKSKRGRKNIVNYPGYCGSFIFLLVVMGSGCFMPFETFGSICWAIVLILAVTSWRPGEPVPHRSTRGF